jgi:predicted amidohydrolase YtcJ
MKRLILFVPLALLVACAREPDRVPRGEVDPTQLTIYHNGTVITMEDGPLIAEAIAIRGEAIDAVGSNEEILALQGSASTLIDLDGRTLMPGFVDAHTHILNDHRSEGMSLDEAQFEALRRGITTLGTLYVDRSFLGEIRDFDTAGFLRVRTSLYLVHTDPCGRVIGDWWKEYPPSDAPGEMLRIAGVKVFTDGGSCGKVALSFELEPGEGTGDLWYTQDELNEMVAVVHAAGYQAAVHAIGDRAVVQALNALEFALDGQSNTPRHRMEHVSVIPSGQIQRFGELGIIPVLIGQYPNCSPYGPPLPEGYREMEWPWRALRDANPDLPIAWHSDVPFQTGNPFVHLLGFVTRLDRTGPAVCPPDDWLRDDTLSVEEALSIMTIQSAHALSRDDEAGSLAPGKLADLIVIANNPLEAESNQLSDNRVLLTVVGGQTEYCRATDADLCPGFTNRDPVRLPDTRPPVVVRWLVAVLLAAFPLTAMFLRRQRTAIVGSIGAGAGIVAGTFWLAFLIAFDRLDDDSFVLIMIPTFLMALGTAGIATQWKQGRLGRFGLWLALLGAIAFSEAAVVSEWFRSELGWGLFMLGVLAHMAGLTLFGFANMKGRVFPRGNELPLVVGLATGLVPLGMGLIFQDDSDLPFKIILGGLGVGWLLMGGLLLATRRAQDHEEGLH